MSPMENWNADEPPAVDPDYVEEPTAADVELADVEEIADDDLADAMRAHVARWMAERG